LLAIFLTAYVVRSYVNDRPESNAVHLMRLRPTASINAGDLQPGVFVEAIDDCTPDTEYGCNPASPLIRVRTPATVFRLVSLNQLQGYTTISRPDQALAYVRIPYQQDFSAIIDEKHGFPPPVVLGKQAPFEIKQWMCAYDGVGRGIEAQFWDETVGADGSYSRSVVTRKPLPLIPGQDWQREKTM
jgi:hypothetical protein